MKQYYIIEKADLNKLLKAASDTGRETGLDYPEAGISRETLDFLTQLGAVMPVSESDIGMVIEKQLTAVLDRLKSADPNTGDGDRDAD